MTDELTVVSTSTEEPKVLQELRIFCSEMRDQKLNAGTDFNQALYDEAVELVVTRLKSKLGEAMG